ncbi:MAG TPA: hypothetical protein VFN35_24390 [Ktedonobacteraceae bacterium]|nr:hypothetical protein [Ktedonobacteraceae bacterium]
MAQALPHFCPRCGTPTRPNMRVCATCGLPAEAMHSRPGNRENHDFGNMPETAQVVPNPKYTQQEQQHYGPPLPPAQPNQWNSSGDTQFSQDPWEALNGPAGNANAARPAQQSWSPPNSPSPVPNAQTARPNNPQSNPGTQAAWSNNPPSNPGNQAAWSNNPPSNPGNQAAWSNNPQSNPGAGWSGNPSPSPLAQAPWMEPSPPPQPGSRKRLGIILVILVILLVLGGGGYAAFTVLGGHVPGLGVSQAQIKTTNLTTALNYAGIDITLQSVQQSQNFADDPQTANDGMLRLHLQEQNKTQKAISWNYSTIAHLLMQGKPAIAPAYVKSQGSLAPGATSTSVVDFAIANGGDLTKLTFQLGGSNEAQIPVPLAGKADLGKYLPHTSEPKKTTTYFGLDWTLTTATASFSIPGQQASTGMEYLTLTLKVDNNLSQEAITGSPFDYLRVKAGDKTAGPVDTTLPVSFAIGDKGTKAKTGTAVFLIPQNNSAVTLILLSQDPGNDGQATIDFQIG